MAQKHDEPVFPEAFEEEMIRILGAEGFQEYKESFKKKRLYGLRVNTLKITPEEFLRIAPWDLTPIPWIENGFYYEENIKPAKHPFYFAGLYYLQEPSAMTPANLLPVEPGDRVLDLCAAPGGKTTELAAKLKGTGILVANDISASRAKGLLKNVEVFGVGNATITCEEPSQLVPKFEEFFDKILIDAPCSGEGMFRKEHKMIKAWEEHGPSFFAEIQKNILECAYRMLRPGGMMLYSTCTFSSMEDEGSIQHLLDMHPDMHVLPVGNYEGFAHGNPRLLENGAEELKNTIRIWPQKMDGEGHFIALLTKDGDAFRPGSGVYRKKTDLSEEARAFLSTLDLDTSAHHYEIKGEHVNWIHNDLPDMKSLRCMRNGLFIGEMKKNRFEPSQALAMYLDGHSYSSCIDLPADDLRITKYLKGETIDLDDVPEAKGSGWRLLTMDHQGLGWGKLSNYSLKNKYLPGWRLM